MYLPALPATPLDSFALHPSARRACGRRGRFARESGRRFGVAAPSRLDRSHGRKCASGCPLPGFEMLPEAGGEITWARLLPGWYLFSSPEYEN